jgi:capsular exopolysaccharide synthesis family protein
MDQQEIDLKELLQILLRRWWLLLALPLVAGLTAGVISYKYLTPIYQASATVWIKGEAGNLDYSTVIASRDLAQTYSQVAMTIGVAQASAKYMGDPSITGEDLYGQLSASPIKDTELLRLTVTDTDPVMAARKANAFAQGFKEEIERSQMIEHIYVVEDARPPGGPIKPRPQMNIAVALVLGLMAAVGLAFLMEYLDTSIRKPEDVARRIGGPILASVPLFTLPEGQTSPRRPQRGAIAPIVFTHSDPTSPASEAFRLLRTNLQFLGLDEPIKSVLITSAVPDEGKSVTSANLAVALAQAGVRVCLVDADLRRPTQNNLFGLDPKVGLTNVLVGALPLEQALAHPMEGLAVLGSGPTPPNPAELLASKRLTALIRDLESQFDMVVIDSVPALGLADAVSLAPQVGGVIMVLRCNGVGYPEAVKAREALLAVKANLLGMVVHGVKEPRGRYYYYHKYYTAGGTRRKGA